MSPIDDSQTNSLVAIVTGGSSGIGAEVVSQLIKRNYRVVAMDRNPPPADKQDGPGFRFCMVDVRNESEVIGAVKSTYEQLGRIDALANCAGIAPSSSIVETTLSGWNEVLAVNLTGTFLFCREAAKFMALGEGGAIVNIASINAHASDPRFAAYNASKAGILGLTRTLAIELGQQQIRANSVSPGLVRTPMVLKGSAADTKVLDYLIKDFRRVPLKRLLEPNEIASVCTFLLSSEASGVTGADFVVDAGLLADSYIINSYPI